MPKIVTNADKMNYNSHVDKFSATFNKILGNFLLTHPGYNPRKNTKCKEKRSDLGHIPAFAQYSPDNKPQSKDEAANN